MRRRVTLALGSTLSLSIALVGATANALWARRRERLATLERLREARPVVADLLRRGMKPVGPSWIIRYVGTTHCTGTVSWRRDLEERARDDRDALDYLEEAPAPWPARPEEVVRDAWGNPVLLLVPGRIHTRGWDLWSCGPNGIDERAEGDDLVFGEDVAK